MTLVRHHERTLHTQINNKTTENNNARKTNNGTP